MHFHNSYIKNTCIKTNPDWLFNSVYTFYIYSKVCVKEWKGSNIKMPRTFALCSTKNNIKLASITLFHFFCLVSAIVEIELFVFFQKSGKTYVWNYKTWKYIKDHSYDRFRIYVRVYNTFILQEFWCDINLTWITLQQLREI